MLKITISKWDTKDLAYKEIDTREVIDEQILFEFISDEHPNCKVEKREGGALYDVYNEAGTFVDYCYWFEEIL